MAESQQLENHPLAPDDFASSPVPVPATGNGLGLASLVIGILAFIGAFLPFVNYASGLLALVGLVLGIVALTRKGRPKRTGTSGVVVSGVALILSIILAIVYTAGFITAVDNSLPKTAAKDAVVTEEVVVADDVADEDAAPASGTRENPAPLGTTIESTTAGAVQYEILLGAATLNANDLVAAENEFNDDPAEGFQYAVVPVTVTYKGTETGTPWVDISVEFVSAAGTTHKPFDVSVVGPAPRLMDVNELYPDASGSGNVVVAIPSADADKGTWVVSSMFGSDKYYFTAQ